jgi:N6-L-threonylcarbamoyladenine synthase
MNINILAIESSCDETSAAIIQDGILLSNVTAGQEVHNAYGGVVPELASRAHQQNIIPVVDRVLKIACIDKKDISAVAFTRGPGLMGSLLVGTSFAKGFALANGIPLIDVNHLHGHVLAHFITEKDIPPQHPAFPFLCLLVSGGHTQIIVVRNYFDLEIIGNTIDDAAGEAFDKCAKVMGLPYPGGPMIDKFAKQGNEKAFTFAKPRIPEFNFSFSGLKTSVLYFIRDRLAENPDFIQQNRDDLCASVQKTIIDILMDKLIKASKQTGIREVAIAGGVSANSALRNAFVEMQNKGIWKVYIPKFSFTTDNAAMIGIVGYLKFLRKEFVRHDIAPIARYPVQ